MIVYRKQPNLFTPTLISILFLTLFSTLPLYADFITEFDNPADDRLFRAIQRHDLESVKTDVASGADVNAFDSYGITTLLIETCKLGYTDIAAYLISEGADINLSAGLGVTPLYAAASEKQLKTVKFLVENGADINFAEGYKETALMAAAFDGSLEIIKFLIKKGADPNLQNIEGVTALMLSVQSPENFETVKYLVEHGADVNIKNTEGGTALSWAEKNEEIIDYLLKKGAIR